MPYKFTTYAGPSLEIPGAASAIPPVASSTPSVVRHHYGTFGESEIRSFVGGRTLVGNIWMYGYGGEFASAADVYSKINEIHNYLNSHGILEEIDANGVVVQEFRHATFKTYTIGNGPDGRPMGPLKDIGKCLNRVTPGYWIILNLTWYQSLTVNDEQMGFMRTI